MSTMFNNFFGKGFKKFANIFWRSGVGNLDLSKDPGIIIQTKSSPEGNSLTEYDYTSICNKDNSNSKILPLSWNEKEKKNKEVVKLQVKKFKSSSFNRLRELINTFSTTDDAYKKNLENELKSNRIKNRVCEIYISANFPREDRCNAIQLKNLDGFFLSVLDGHGGDDVAEFANKELHKKIDEKYKQIAHDENLKDQQKVKLAIYNAFQEIEKDYYNKAIEKYQSGEGKYAYIGSCALCVVVHDNLLYVANLGDCKAKLFRKEERFLINNRIEVSYIPIKLSITYNASKLYEQKRLREKFKDGDIVVDKGVACYVKGRLQPTRSLGDFYMKYKEFNTPPINIEERYLRKVFEKFNGPYIDNIPDIQVFELVEEDEFLILATDGLWDWLNSRDVADIINKHRNDKSQIAQALLKEALTRAADKAKLNFDQVMELPRSIKRSIHDDISILVVDLKNQVTYKKTSKINELN